MKNSVQLIKYRDKTDLMQIINKKNPHKTTDENKMKNH